MSRTPGYLFTLLSACAVILAGCGGKAGSGGAPPQAKVEQETDVSLLQVEHPEQFPVVRATESLQAPSLTVTGVVGPDVSRTVPVISLASGRVVEIRARLGDTVQKGQVLLRVQSSDIASAFADYRKATADEVLVRKQFDRAQILYDKGAISLNDFQVAEDAESKAKVDLETAQEHLHVLGVDKDHPSGIVEIKAPVSGVITDQQVTGASGVQGLAGANPFTISDLTHVWILCDVYENDLANVHLGETAEIRLVAYPDKVLNGKISNIGPILDPNMRTAKVRVEVTNPGGLMRVGMFANATFRGQKKERLAVLPASAILHLHDRDWVYVPAGDKEFRRVEVKAGAILPDKMQLVLSGIDPGQPVVSNALVMQNAAEQ
ncbi:MAG TPA: efflux RND transporter periplasmic adaptor subunit [Candidatus Sulfotelmatobacter sp.]|jgi:cobalt-zinc-cadmium efflux system membrane fusion protein|nr:efflux RND transporter periplasmic adaptor subunit [Candidatus Sulfotelmatobacter sp.]